MTNTDRSEALITADLYTAIDMAIEVTTNGNAVILRYGSSRDAEITAAMFDHIREHN